jgi:dTMP kinase
VEKRGNKEMKHFVTFEGIDGSGKSTISRYVYNRLKSEGYDVIYTYEPTDSWIGKKVQYYIKTDADPFIIAFTFFADRIEHGKQIQKWMEQGKIILCDRYAESTYAYQGTQLEGKIENPIYWLKNLSKNRFPKPEQTFLFLIKPTLAIQRIKKRKHLVPFEQVKFLEKVQNNYRRLSRGKRFIKIDATQSVESIVGICYQNIME